jgi:DNA-binding transcriptional MerR regulator
MNDTRQGLLSIGSFASAAQLSLKALRLYAQLGILTPIHIDPESSYRYYHADQLQTARLIRMMRQIDMPLASIRQVLAAAPADAERMVIEHCNMLDARAEQARRTVQDLVCYLRQEVPTMTLDVSVQTAAPQQVMSITKRVKVEQLGNQIGESLASLYALTEAQGIKTTGAPFGIYHGPVNQEDDGPIEVCVPIERPLAATGNAVSRELAGGRVASVMMTGDQCEFPAILDGYDAVYDWIRKNGYEVIESPREIWHSLPGETQRTEIAWLFREPAG